MGVTRRIGYGILDEEYRAVESWTQTTRQLEIMSQLIYGGEYRPYRPSVSPNNRHLQAVLAENAAMAEVQAAAAGRVNERALLNESAGSTSSSSSSSGSGHMVTPRPVLARSPLTLPVTVGSDDDDEVSADDDFRLTDYVIYRPPPQLLAATRKAAAAQSKEAEAEKNKENVGHKTAEKVKETKEDDAPEGFRWVHIEIV